MATRAKYLWRAFWAACTALSFFGLAFWPSNWSAAKLMLQHIDHWIFAHAASPSLFALCVGLAIGTIIIPDVWSEIKRHFFPTKPEAGTKIKNAIDYLVNDSRAHLKKARRSELMQTGPAKGQYVHMSGVEHSDAVSKLNEKMNSRDLLVWGHRQFGGRSNLRRCFGLLRLRNGSVWRLTRCSVSSPPQNTRKLAACQTMFRPCLCSHIRA
jgi:hypothetical protein